MPAVSWKSPPDRPESLALCLKALLRSAGGNPQYDELVSLLGLGSLTTAVAEHPVQEWPSYGRDVALISTAGLLGLRLRDLHPPAAAARLDASAEYPQHFRDSYIPLIERALAAEQPVLAWAGWPPPAELAWGLITYRDGDKLLGHTLGHDALVVFSGPALQVYVVEALHPAYPPAAAMLRHIALLADRAWRGDLPAPPGLTTGDAAHAHWQAILNAAPAESLPHHAALAERLSAARRCLEQTLRRLAPQLAQSAQQHADEIAAAADACAAQLLQFAGRCRRASHGLDTPAQESLLTGLQFVRCEEVRLAELCQAASA